MVGYQLGVDLGTTYCAAAVSREGRVEIADLGVRSTSMPSVVFLGEDGKLLVGDAALRRGVTQPDRLAREFKRRFGDPVPVMIAGSPMSSDLLTARLLSSIVETVTERQGQAPDAVVVCHPANWGPYKRDLLAQAVRLAGVPDAVLLSEPEAAAVSYAAGDRLEAGQVVAVYDLGGGTFDAAVLRRTASGFELLGRPEGIERLGGVDFDEAVLDHVQAVVGAPLTELDAEDPAVATALIRLRTECTQAKEALSEDTDAVIPVMLPGVQTEVPLTRAEFESMIRPSLAPTLDVIERVIGSAELAPAELSAVLLVGGSSRIPLVSALVTERLGRPVVTDAHPKNAVALGAATAAAASIAGPAIAPTPPVPVTPVPVTPLVTPQLAPPVAQQMAPAVPNVQHRTPPAPPPPAPSFPAHPGYAQPPAAVAQRARSGGAILAVAVVAGLLLIGAAVVVVLRTGGFGGTTGTESFSPAPTGAPAQTGTAVPLGVTSASGLVRLSPAAAAHPSAMTVLALADRHFTAINNHDYAGWTTTVAPSLAGSQSGDRWRLAYRSTRDEAVEISSITDAGSDAVAVVVSFISTQDIADAPPDLAVGRICWRSQWPVVNVASGGRINVAPRGSTTKQAC